MSFPRIALDSLQEPDRAQIYHVSQSDNRPSIPLSRQSEKFLIGQSRKFLLTAARLKDGTNRDESVGAGQAGMAEAGEGKGDYSARGGREDRGQRALGAQAAEADEEERGCSRGAWLA